MSERTHYDVLAEIQQTFNTVRNDVDRLGGLIATFANMVPVPDAGVVSSQPTRRIKSMDEWVEWLAENRPVPRSVLVSNTGTDLTITARKQVLHWKEHMEMWTDDQLPDTVLLSIDGPKRGTGRPPLIFFLWSQRHTLYPLYGVGPVPEQVTE